MRFVLFECCRVQESKNKEEEEEEEHHVHVSAVFGKFANRVSAGLHLFTSSTGPLSAPPPSP